MKSFRFELNFGQYVLFADGVRVSRPLKEVALCLDKISGTVHRFGDPYIVNAWCTKNQDALRNAGEPEKANDLVVMQGRFTLDDLNKVMETGWYGATLFQMVINQTLDTLDLNGNVVRPGPSTCWPSYTW